MSSIRPIYRFIPNTKTKPAPATTPSSSPKTPVPKAAAPRITPVAPPTRIPSPQPRRVSAVAASPALSDYPVKVAKKPTVGTY